MKLPVAITVMNRFSNFTIYAVSLFTMNIVSSLYRQKCNKEVNIEGNEYIIQILLKYYSIQLEQIKSKILHSQ